MKSLEDAIRADPEAVEPYLVFGDALQEKGDPLGEWIAIHRAFSVDQASLSEAALRERSRLRKHRDPLLRTLLGERLFPLQKQLKLKWHMGFVRSANIDGWTVNHLDEILRNRLFRFLRGLSVGTLADDPLRKKAELLPDTLEDLWILDAGWGFRFGAVPAARTDEGWGDGIDLGDVSPILRRTPRLRTLTLTAREVGAIDGVVLSRLATLRLMIPHHVTRVLEWALTGGAPSLAHLAIGLYEDEARAVMRLIASSSIGSLELHTGVGWHAQVIALLGECSLPSSIESIDCRSMRLNADERKAIGEVQLAKRPVKILYD